MTDAELGRWLQTASKYASVSVSNEVLTALVALLGDILAEGSLNYSTEARLRVVLGEGR